MGYFDKGYTLLTLVLVVLYSMMCISEDLAKASVANSRHELIPSLCTYGISRSLIVR